MPNDSNTSNNPSRSPGNNSPNTSIKPDKLLWWVIGFGAVMISGFLLVGAYSAYTNPKPARELPYFKPLGRDTTVGPDGKMASAVQYHKVPAFSFSDQTGQIVTEKVMEGKITIVDYFFTTCQSICPVMTDGLVGVAKYYEQNPNILILSHTVDPETDSVPVMAQYAKDKGIKTNQWHLLTGDKAALYKQAREGYFLDAQEGNGGPEDFIHTQLFALIDKEGHIRGYYDGTSKPDLKRLQIDIDLLLQYYRYKAGNTVGW